MFQKCYLPKDKPAYDKGIACYTVWFGDQSFQGCWINPMPSLQQCEKRKCRADASSTTGINFCCCFGDQCNAEYSTA
uniref:Activin_recp domain-containing protein n=1 Tax=Steinernema glaseri TaxID=37863 RepID=A0A1I7YDL2_9BILA